MLSPTQLQTETGSVAAALAMTPVNVMKAKVVGVEISTTVATPAAKEFVSGTAEVGTIVCIADTGVLEVQTVTFQSKAASTAGDYVVISDIGGRQYACSVDKLGTGIEPTGAIWSAITSDFKTTVDISGATDAASVAALFEIAFNSLREFTTFVTTDDTAGAGALKFTQNVFGNNAAVVVKNATDAGAGGITKAETTAGVASNLNNTYFKIYEPDGNNCQGVWFNVGSQGVEPVESGVTMNEVAIAASATADTVAAAVELVIEALAFSSTVLTDTVTYTGNNKYNLTNAADSTEAPTGFTFAITTPGVNNDFSISSNEITIASHGFATGLKVAATTTSALPTGLSATDYWVIKVDANTIKLATSAANAIAGTAVNITGDGAGTHTLTPAAISGGSYKLQISFDGVTYYDLASGGANITATADFQHQLVDPAYNYLRVLFAVTTGQIAYVINTLVKEEQ